MKMKGFFFAALFLTSGLTIVPAQVKLSFNPAKGAKYEYQTELTTKWKTTIKEIKLNFKTIIT